MPRNYFCRTVWLLILLTPTFVLPQTGCASHPAARQKKIKQPELVTKFLLSEMDPALVSSRIFAKTVIEVDWVSGSEPDDQALRDFMEVAQTLLPEKSLELFMDDVIPADSWPEHPNEASFDSIAARWLDNLPRDDRDTIYVLYVPHSPAETRYAGRARGWVIDRGRGPRFVPGMYVDLGVIEKNALPFSRQASLESYALVHEFGHVLGLVSNPQHEQLHSPGHCVHPRCVMHGIGNRRSLSQFLTGLPGATLPKRFCDECRADLHSVRAHAATTPMNQLTNDSLAHAARAISAWHWRRHQRAKALATLRRALQADPSNPRLAFQLARALAEEGKIRDALRLFDAVPKRQLTESMRTSFAHYLCRSAKYRVALKILPNRPSNFSKNYIRARVWALEGCGEYLKAVEILEAYARTDGVRRGERHWIDERAARLLLHAGRLNAARDYLEKDSGYPKYWPTSKLLLSADVARDQEDVNRAAADLLHARQRLTRFIARTEDQRSPRVLLARYTLLEILARQGDAAAFRNRLSHLQFPPNYGDAHRQFYVSLRHRFARALSRGGETTWAMDLLANAAAWEYPRGPSEDPCLDRGFKVIRQREEFGELYPLCPNQKPGGPAE